MSRINLSFNLGKGLFCVLLLWLCFSITKAYLTEPEAVEVKFSGVDFDQPKLAFVDSPLVRHKVGDTRTNNIPVALDTSKEDQANSVRIYGGNSLVTGKIIGPDGPVSGAIVRLERTTLEGSMTEDVRTDSSGSYRFKGILGGRYSIRSWLPGKYTSGEPDLFFLDGVSDDDKDVKNSKPVFKKDITIRGVSSSPSIDYSTGGSIYAGSSGVVAVTVTKESVSTDGIVIVSPASGTQVQVGVSGLYSLVGSSSKFIDSTGNAVFTLRCSRPTSNGSLKTTIRIPDVENGQATYKSYNKNYSIPACVKPPQPKPKEEVTTTLKSKNKSNSSSTTVKKSGGKQ